MDEGEENEEDTLPMALLENVKKAVKEFQASMSGLKPFFVHFCCFVLV